MTNSYKGFFIVFEGLDGSGQTTQANLLKNFLEKKGFGVLLTKEPTLETKEGKEIKKVLEKKIKKSPLSLQKLFAKDREKHLKRTIEPALRKGKIVISDRYLFSSLAYGSLNVSLKKLKELNKNFLLPDLVFFLNVKSDDCLKRIKKRGEKIHLFEEKEIFQLFESVGFKKVYQNYQLILKNFKNVYFINGEKPKREVFREIKKIINRYLTKIKN